MRAMDVLSAACNDLDAITTKLIELRRPTGESLGRQVVAHQRRAPWRPWRASNPPTPSPESLGRRRTPSGKCGPRRRRPAACLGTKHTATKLARDPEPNVQTAALDALFRMRSPAVVPQAIDALKNGSDYQLIRTAAMVLKGLPDESKDEASNALLIAMRKLTDQESDTSRDPRLAIVDRLAETLSPGRSHDLLPFATDLDDEVNAAVIKLFTRLVNAPPVPSKRQSDGIRISRPRTLSMRCRVRR